jgi:hypothetical protein
MALPGSVISGYTYAQDFGSARVFLVKVFETRKDDSYAAFWISRGSMGKPFFCETGFFRFRAWGY